MNPNEHFKKNDPEKWKILCYRFIGRHRRLQHWEDMEKKGTKCPEVVVDKERHLVQEAYEQMREACLMDEDYKVVWEHKDKNNT